ncbi:hypothetical protein B0H14DRAFT_3530732 [Mycena olivaceomarginata]|nr:hypothetical protein B0H14DRAFT_3530732 [Mycena olivaceomarginata]
MELDIPPAPPPAPRAQSFCEIVNPCGLVTQLPSSISSSTPPLLSADSSTPRSLGVLLLRCNPVWESPDIGRLGDSRTRRDALQGPLRRSGRLVLAAAPSLCELTPRLNPDAPRYPRLHGSRLQYGFHRFRRLRVLHLRDAYDSTIGACSLLSSSRLLRTIPVALHLYTPRVSTDCETLLRCTHAGTRRDTSRMMTRCPPRAPALAHTPAQCLCAFTLHLDPLPPELQRLSLDRIALYVDREATRDRRRIARCVERGGTHARTITHARARTSNFARNITASFARPRLLALATFRFRTLRAQRQLCCSMRHMDDYTPDAHPALVDAAAVFLRALTLYLDPACRCREWSCFCYCAVHLRNGYDAVTGTRHVLHYHFPGLHSLRLRCRHDAPSLRTRCCILPASSASVLCTIASFLAWRAVSAPSPLPLPPPERRHGKHARGAFPRAHRDEGGLLESPAPPTLARSPIRAAVQLYLSAPRRRFQCAARCFSILPRAAANPHLHPPRLRRLRIIVLLSVARPTRRHGLALDVAHLIDDSVVPDVLPVHTAASLRELTLHLSICSHSTSRTSRTTVPPGRLPHAARAPSPCLAPCRSEELTLPFDLPTSLGASAATNPTLRALHLRDGFEAVIDNSLV